MPLFGDNRIDQILLQGAQLINQTIQHGMALENQRMQMQENFLLKEEHLKIEQAKLDKQKQVDELDTTLKRLQIRKALEDVAKDESGAQDRMLKAQHLELSSDDPVEINRQYQTVDELGKRRNSVQAQLTDAKGKLIPSNDPIFGQLESELSGLDASLKWRIEEGAKRFSWSKEEAVIPIKSKLLQGGSTPAPAASAVQAALSGGSVQNAPTTDLNLLVQDYLGQDKTKKTTALTSLKAAAMQVRGDSNAATSLAGRLIPLMPGATNADKIKAARTLLEELQK